MKKQTRIDALIFFPGHGNLLWLFSFGKKRRAGVTGLRCSDKRMRYANDDQHIFPRLLENHQWCNNTKRSKRDGSWNIKFSLVCDEVNFSIHRNFLTWFFRIKNGKAASRKLPTRMSFMYHTVDAYLYAGNWVQSYSGQRSLTTMAGSFKISFYIPAQLESSGIYIMGLTTFTSCTQDSLYEVFCAAHSSI